jgi:flagellar basal-body rod modification protein FlgD
MTTGILSGVSNTVKSATTTPSTSSSGSSANSSSSSGIDSSTIAGNFNTFLTLLTTQLQNQDPTNPLDTNQFTQQLVQFAQVEQQLKSNTELSSLVSLQQSAQATQTLDFVGKNVTVNSNTAELTNGQTSWTFSSPQPASATLNISNASGQLVYSGSMTMQTGTNTFNWNGQGTNGTQWPDGAYTMSVTAQSAAGQSVGVSTVVSGTVSSVDLTKTPPVLSINGQPDHGRQPIGNRGLGGSRSIQDESSLRRACRVQGREIDLTFHKSAPRSRR